RCQLQMLHDKHPAERGRGVEGEAKVKPRRLKRLLAPAGDLEKVVTQNADDTEGNRHEHRESLCSHRRPPTSLAIGLLKFYKSYSSERPAVGWSDWLGLGFS